MAFVRYPDNSVLGITEYVCKASSSRASYIVDVRVVLLVLYVVFIKPGRKVKYASFYLLKIGLYPYLQHCASKLCL